MIHLAWVANFMAIFSASYILNSQIVTQIQQEFPKISILKFLSQSFYPKVSIIKYFSNLKFGKTEERIVWANEDFSVGLLVALDFDFIPGFQSSNDAREARICYRLMLETKRS